MERDKKTRTIERSAFTKLHNHLTAELVKGVIDKTEITANATLLEKRATELKRLDKIIFEQMLDSEATLTDFEQETTTVDEYNRKYEKIRVEIENSLKPVETDYIGGIVADEQESVVSTRSTRNTLRKFKLPEIELKKFDDDVKNWLHFWGQFRKIDEDDELAAEDKFQYLVQATVEGSRAHKLVTSFPPTADNYNKAIEGLKGRFGREDLLIEVYVRELLTLVLSRVARKLDSGSLCSLYDRLECHLRALESLGVTSEKYDAMLLPLVESSLPEDLLRTWQRTVSTIEEATPKDAEERSTSQRLKKLMSFLRSEVQNEERIKMATSSFSLPTEQKDKKKKTHFSNAIDVPTATSLVNVKEEKNNNNCIFCDKKHNSVDCFKARKLTLDEKRKIVNEKRCCYHCLKTNHYARKCRAYSKCAVCAGRHAVVMCPRLPLRPDAHMESTNGTENEVLEHNTTLTNASTHPEVFLQTLVVKIKCGRESCLARAMIDTGSQKSYVLEDTATKMNMKSSGKERLIHKLFGGVETLQQEHKQYKIRVSSIDDQYSCELDVLGQQLIVKDVSPIRNGMWMNELQKMGIKLTDTGENRGPIQLLIGADAAGLLFTSRQVRLTCGVVALETKLGWTLLGKSNGEKGGSRCHCTATTIISMLVQDAPICNLWELDTLGIKDPIEAKSKHAQDLEVQRRFLEDVRINAEKRYEIRLPWKYDKPDVPSNYETAEKRLHSLTKKLKAENNFESYDQLLKEWCDEGIIEKVNSADKTKGHYLPHRHVVKENSTTRIRPVFDASSKIKTNSSLNDCLEIGPNMIEMIPAILLRFRINVIGVIADIKRAFLQISVAVSDRDFLKFLWWDRYGYIQVYRHARVVFGVSSSPFLLAAVIDFHLNKVLNDMKQFRSYNVTITPEIIQKLRDSFYVDNCVTSVKDVAELKQFIREAELVMKMASFNLRGWEYTSTSGSDNALNETVMVLGLKWNKVTDTLEINVDSLKMVDTTCVTKRLILVVAHKLFDPIGFICPLTIHPKLLLQQTWQSRIGWDTEVDEETKTRFCKWYRELSGLTKVKIPRWLIGKKGQEQNFSIHTFCDASKAAYAAAIFLRTEDTGGVNIQLVQAKTRIAPLKPMTIPRLELMAATVGARLTAEVLKQLVDIKVSTITYWSDSMTVLAWIKRTEKWEVFVKNRVHEIRQLTRVEDWRHVPGELNPADLPSRGCNLQQLLERKWWEGPSWLKLPSELWPRTVIENNEAENVQESMTATNSTEDFTWYYKYFSNYERIVRLVAWIARFIFNCKNRQAARHKNSLSVTELLEAEKKIFKLIQRECFKPSKINNLSSLNTFYDKEGIMRVKTQITFRDDTANFRYPIVLPDEHPVVRLLVLRRHKTLKHAGVQMLLNDLREDFWIVRGRRSVRKILKQCVVCKRHAAKNVEVEPCALPSDRVRDSRIFEVVGVDYAGPLHLRGNTKTWVCLFTCAVYRGVHLELVSSLSTECFLQALRRFVARRGRPSKIYSDNGTNFVGSNNLLKALDWSKIETFANIHRIEWKFNPPTAAWWGGWWERLIRILKDLLRRVLSKSCVTYEEMLTLLIECEAIINSRPITYMMDGDSSVAPLTPNMFLQEIREVGVPDLDHISKESLNKRERYLQKLKADLKRRFRDEYLGCLAQRTKLMPDGSGLKIGEVVLIGSDKKRSDWPLGRIIEMYPGKDDKCRLVKLCTAKGEVLRPVQRLYQLELRSEECPEAELPKEDRVTVPEEVPDDDVQETNGCKTRSGRIIKLPKRYSD